MALSVNPLTRQKIRSAAAMSLAALLLTAGCTPAAPPSTNRVVERTDILASGDPDQIAHSGHGMVFDAKMRRIMITDKSLLAMQETLFHRLKVDAADTDPALIKQLSSGNLTSAEHFWLRGAQINSLLAKRGDPDSQRLMRINLLLLQNSWRSFDLRLNSTMMERIRELLGPLVLPGEKTDYMERCRAAGVPVPPDFSTTSAEWQDQGALVTNLLEPGVYAGVFTYHDPKIRGACVALPRGDGTAGSAAGIICQSAETGAACFWDNLLRSGGPTAAPLGWRNTTLRIANLQDGDNLADNCTRCHSGNNVYLVSPDDPTWGRLLRRTMAGTDHGNFTLRVRNSTDASSPAESGGTFRYVPISNQGWVNNRIAPNCTEGCHEGISEEIMMRWNAHVPIPPMPPICSLQAGAPENVERCYVNPF